MRLLYILCSVVQAGQIAPPIKVTAKTDQRSIPSSVKKDTITADAIKKNQYSTLDNVLNNFPGLTVVQSGSMGQPTSLFARGANSNHMQVRLDGMRINSPDAANGTLDTGLLSPDNLSSVSFIRGGQGSLYGPDAVGGVLLMTTPKATGAKEQLLIEGGTARTAKLSGNASHQFSKVGVYMGAEAVRSSGIHQTPVEYRQDGGRYPRLYFRQNGIVGRIDHEANDKAQFMWVSRYSQADSLIQLFDRAAPQERENILHRGQMTLQHTPQWHHQIGAGFFQSSQKNAIHDRFFSQSQGTRSQIDWTQNYKTEKLGDFSTTFEGAQDQVQQKNLTSVLSIHQDSIGIGGLWEKKTDWVDGDFSIRRDKVASFNPAMTHREGLALKPWSGGKIRASYGTSFKTPTLYQLHAKTPYYTGNSNLKPEKSHQWDAGFDQLIFKNFKWEETVFVNKLTRLIYPTSDFKSNTNLGKSRVRGLESGLNWVVQTWQVSLNYTVMKAENLLDHTQLLRRPKTKLSGAILYQSQGWVSGIEIFRLGHRPDIDPVKFTRIIAKPYTLIHIKTQKTLESGLRLFGRIENLLNRKIQEPVGYRKSGLTIYLGMEKTIA